MLDDREQLEARSDPAGEGSADARAVQVRQAGGGGRSSRPGRACAPRRACAWSLGVVGALALGAGGYYGHYWWTTGRYLVSTDDAYVGAKNATLSPKVSGYIADVAVEDNAQVAAGDVIARIDDGDYRLAVQTARDQIAVQQATIERLGQADRLRKRRRSTRPRRSSPPPRPARPGPISSSSASRTWRRGRSTAAPRSSRRRPTTTRPRPPCRPREAAIESAAANVDVLKAQQEEAARTLRSSRPRSPRPSAISSFTVIRAPFDGVIGNRAVQVGDYVQPTQRLASLVPLDAVYVDANFKETQLARLQPGQPVTITVDALPGHKIEGRVASVAPASGSVFSLLPPDNATGNFTKIVQRLPVRILVPADVAEQAVLRPGMSVVVNVNTKPGAPARPGDEHGCPAHERQVARPDRQEPGAMANTSAAIATMPASAASMEADDRIEPRRLVAFLAMVFGMFMAILDIQIVSASLTEIQAGLAASANEITWVQTAYLIAEVVMIPLSGYLSRALGTRCCSPSRPAASRRRA